MKLNDTRYRWVRAVANGHLDPLMPRAFKVSFMSSYLWLVCGDQGVWSKFIKVICIDYELNCILRLSDSAH